jgi:DNA polymerase (family 10)
MMPQIREIEARLTKLSGVERVVVAGSVRRRKETIGDVDILVTVQEAGGKKEEKAAKSIMDYFVGMPEVVRVYAHGDTKSAVKLRSGLDVDLRVVPKGSYGAALNYFTGSKDHNVALREIAIKKGMKLNEYGLFADRRGKVRGQTRKEVMIAGRTEEELYNALGMDYIEPEMREMKGEMALAQKHLLPKLIGYDELRGDLQVQTDWTDGSASILEMAKAAMAQGLQYIAITDHTKRLAMTHGLDEKRIQKQWLEIDRVNKKLQASGFKFQVLKGTECDILKDGSLDLPDSILAKLDVVGASVHSHFNLSVKEQTTRIIRAVENPNVDVLFHPTGRRIGRREAYKVDMGEIVMAAKRVGAVLEVDAYPDRLDLHDEHVRMAVKAGVKLAIDSDAHSPEHFPYLEYGIAQARRGWAKRKDVINAWPLEKMRAMLKK